MRLATRSSGVLAHSVVLLGPWQYYHGYCLVVSRQHATELSQLSDIDRRGYLDEMCRVARILEECFQPHKLNYEPARQPGAAPALANLFPALHQTRSRRRSSRSGMISRTRPIRTRPSAAAYKWDRSHGPRPPASFANIYSV